VISNFANQDRFNLAIVSVFVATVSFNRTLKHQT